jgi:subtilase family serine protease
MGTEGRSIARRLLPLAAILLAVPASHAQHVVTVLPHIDPNGENPITFMRTHYELQPIAPISKSHFGRTVVTLPTPPQGAFTPAGIRHAYGIDKLTNEGQGKVIGIVDAYDDPNAEADLAVFSAQFGLPACTTSNGCFRKVYSGSQPSANSNWAIEIALDVEWAHAVAPKATILLVEAPSNSFNDLLNGAKVAVRDGASVVSMSWTVGEFSGEASYDNNFASNGVTFVAAAGDSGTGVAYPAVSPDVTGVGGTTLTVDANGNYLSETAWSESGGGISSAEKEPLYQAQFEIPDDTHGKRGVPDVSYNANPGTGYAIYDSLGISGVTGWFQVGGTSAGTPQWAALIAIANSMRTAQHKTNLSSTNTILYSLAKANATDFHVVTQGENGTCGQVCDAMAGYDYITGLGTPQASALISALATH